MSRYTLALQTQRIVWGRDCSTSGGTGETGGMESALLFTVNRRGYKRYSVLPKYMLNVYTQKKKR